MGEAMAACDMVVSRAGATSAGRDLCASYPGAARAVPYATADHQTTNAKAYVARGAALMIADADVESDEFATLVFDLIGSEPLRDSMREAAATFEIATALARSWQMWYWRQRRRANPLQCGADEEAVRESFRQEEDPFHRHRWCGRMSGIACVAQEQGSAYLLRSARKSLYQSNWKDAGIRIFIGQRAENIPAVDPDIGHFHGDPRRQS